MHSRRRDELESRIATLETEYEELIEKTIHDEEISNVDVAESMAELKVCAFACIGGGRQSHGVLAE